MKTRTDTPGMLWLGRLDNLIEAIERFTLAYSVILMAAMSVTNVVARNLFNNSLAWTAEISRILIVLITFLGIGYGVRHARHIRMSALYDQLRGFPRKTLLVISQLGTAALLLALTWFAVEYVLGQYDTGRRTPALQLPVYWIYLWVPVGLLLGGLQYLLAALRNLFTPGLHLSFQQQEAYEQVAPEEEH